MAFVAEDGTGLANSNSYGSLDEFQAYWLERGQDMTQFTEGNRQSALVQACDHIELFFGPCLFGYRASETQALEFPRLCLFDRNGFLLTGVPMKVKAAQFEYAQRILANDVILAPDPTRDASGLQIQATYKKVGPLEKRITYTTGSPRLLPAFPKADAYLRDLVYGTGGGSYRA